MYSIMNPYAMAVLHILTKEPMPKTKLYIGKGQMMLLDKMIEHGYIINENNRCRLSADGALLYKELQPLSMKFDPIDEC